MIILNVDIAQIFDRMADLLEIEGANPFRVRAYRNASRTIRAQSREIQTLLGQGFDPRSLPGIGEDLSGKIREIVSTGRLNDLETLEQDLPVTLLELLKIPGLGPKRVRRLYLEAGIRTVGDLSRAIRSGKLSGLKGFGEVLLQRIEGALTSRGEEHRFRIDVAEKYARSLLARIEEIPGILAATVAGSYRRRQETVGDLDILVVASPGSPAMDRFIRDEGVETVVSHGKTRATVLLHGGLQVDLRVVSEEQAGAALHYFTGSKAHGIAVRRMAQDAGLKLNEYGVFRQNERVAGRTEMSVFRSVGLPYIPPELRENDGEIEAARTGHLPVLVERVDLKGDLHSHTSATDGKNSLLEMRDAALARGFEYLAITEHSRSLAMVHGLDGDGTLRHAEKIRSLSREVEGLTLLAGMEVDILADGSLDLPDSVLSRLDFAIAAVHSHRGLSRGKQTERILKAMDNPYVTILAHPGGRILGERPSMELDWPKLFRHARDRRTILEINSQPDRLDLTDHLARMAMEEGVLLAINSDAHSVFQFDNLHYGIGQARRGWLSREHVANTRSLSELNALFSRIRLK